MQCIYESEEFLKPCKKGHQFCMEDKCPDYVSIYGDLQQEDNDE